MIAKVMVHDSNRTAAIEKLGEVLSHSTICGPPTNCNFHFLHAIVPSIAKFLAGNPSSTEGLEITLEGPELRFLTPACISICGAPMDMTLDGTDVPMWTRLCIKLGNAPYFRSKSTFPLPGIGGYQGRSLTPGVMLVIAKLHALEAGPEVSLPSHLRPIYPHHWDIYAMVGPYDEGYIVSEDIDMIYDTVWNVSHNSTRGGIGLVGPAHGWAREEAGEGGQHPSNVIEYGYPTGTLNWTGDRELSENVSALVASQFDLNTIEPISGSALPESTISGNRGKALVYRTELSESGIHMTFRQGGDEFLLVGFGDGKFNLNHRCQVRALERAFNKSQEPYEDLRRSVYKTTGCCNCLSTFWHRQRTVGYLRNSKVPSRKFRLPICFESPAQEEAVQRYMETQRPHAPYLPSNIDFVAKANGITHDELVDIFLSVEFVAICVGFCCCDTIRLPVDPHYLLICPKQNPSRVYTLEGSVSWGGLCMNIYPVDSPGGYQMTGQTIPCLDQLGVKPDLLPSQPGLFRDLDQITFYRVEKEELECDIARFRPSSYKFQFEDVTFDMIAHNRLLDETRDEVAAVKSRQAAAQVGTLALEKESMDRWMAEKAQNSVPADEVSLLRQDPDILTLYAPLDTNVWKVNVADGDIICSAKVVAILEAMGSLRLLPWRQEE
ncbi:unnamed protein product [Penicillium egyptiacum]|uniref:Carboxyltransferase domain-containing protein n=1 Tax=Penicillium egyptiacum TaxID=1303716 RepID=A0A9W4KPG2_9EURO|nr:unnamed protein product [Penicillium egyptiacum]